MLWWVVSGSVHILLVSAMIVSPLLHSVPSLHLQYNVTVLATILITLLLLEVLHTCTTDWLQINFWRNFDGKIILSYFR